MRGIRKQICSLLSVWVLIFQLPLTAHAANGVPDAVIRASESVVRIVSDYYYDIGTGSGFVFYSGSDKILIATNYHVVEDDPVRIYVYAGDEDAIEASIVCYSAEKDLCILQLEKHIKIKALRLAREDVERGQDIYAIGFPAAADNFLDGFAHTSEDATITNGIVSATRKLSTVSRGSPVTILQINADINPGNSGGPLLDSAGNVVGINTYRSADGAQGINGAVAVSELIEMINTFDLPAQYSTGNTKSIPVYVWAIAGAAVALAAAAMLRFKKRTVVRDRPETALSLKTVLSRYPGGMPSREAVSLLMPVADQIKNYHKQGILHLHISPDNITVIDGRAVLINPDPSDSYDESFTAPEALKGGPLNAAADVYSLAAVLYYAITAITPENAAFRPDDILPFPESVYDSTLKEILQTAMAINPKRRFSSVQALINSLRPYYSG